MAHTPLTVSAKAVSSIPTRRNLVIKYSAALSSATQHLEAVWKVGDIRFSD